MSTVNKTRLIHKLIPLIEWNEDDRYKCKVNVSQLPDINYKVMKREYYVDNELIYTEIIK